jgi:hypothetical protein
VESRPRIMMRMMMRRRRRRIVAVLGLRCKR